FSFVRLGKRQRHHPRNENDDSDQQVSNSAAEPPVAKACSQWSDAARERTERTEDSQHASLLRCRAVKRSQGRDRRVDQTCAQTRERESGVEQRRCSGESEQGDAEAHTEQAG